jgi:hypothetical protein
MGSRLQNPKRQEQSTTDLRSLGLKYCTATSNQETVCIIQNTKNQQVDTKAFRPPVFLSSAHGHCMDSSGTKLEIGASWNENFAIKLGDFGTACKLQEDIPQSTRIGTEAFLAPVE